jgi:Cu2+-exporting ATPase
MTQTTVLHVGGLHWATSEHAVESTLARQEGVASVEANAANQSATVSYDPHLTSVAELAGWVRDCGYSCAGRSVPMHVCEPMDDSARHEAAAAQADVADHAALAPPAVPQRPRPPRRSSTRPTR